ncbi:hypothetical protein ALC53_13661, partial [Atta colombica]
DVYKLLFAISDYYNYKAKDWKSWFLYYCIFVYYDYDVSKKYVYHYALLVKSNLCPDLFEQHLPFLSKAIFIS